MDIYYYIDLVQKAIKEISSCEDQYMPLDLFQEQVDTISDGIENIVRLGAIGTLIEFYKILDGFLDGRKNLKITDEQLIYYANKLPLNHGVAGDLVSNNFHVNTAVTSSLLNWETKTNPVPSIRLAANLLKVGDYKNFNRYIMSRRHNDSSMIFSLLSLRWMTGDDFEPIKETLDFVLNKNKWKTGIKYKDFFNYSQIELRRICYALEFMGRGDIAATIFKNQSTIDEDHIYLKRLMKIPGFVIDDQWRLTIVSRLTEWLKTKNSGAIYDSALFYALAIYATGKMYCIEEIRQKLIKSNHGIIVMLTGLSMLKNEHPDEFGNVLPEHIDSLVSDAILHKYKSLKHEAIENNFVAACISPDFYKNNKDFKRSLIQFDMGI